MSSIYGASILVGDNTIPGLKLPENLRKAIPMVLDECRKFGLDFNEAIIEYLNDDDMSEIAAYGGFPQRIPHWSYGMEYEELIRGYEHGQYRIYEMIANNCPCLMYLLNSNTYTDNVTVIAHATGHNDFFKNNLWFRPTSQNMLNELANHRSRALRYIDRWGQDDVEMFIDDCMAIETLVDPAKAWTTRKYEEVQMSDSRERHHPRRLKIPEGHEYMQEFINPKSWIHEQEQHIKDDEIKHDMMILHAPDKDIMGYIRDHANLKLWQMDVLSMLYQEAMYFQPQRCTKALNEGWASYIDFSIMARQGMPNCSIVDYSAHKAGVLGGKYSMNPYKLGFELFLYIEDCWNKGRFGREWEDCTNAHAREHWDKKLGLGKEKVFEVRANYDDVTSISQFLDQDFVDKHKFFEWKKFKSAEPGVAYEYRIVSRDAKRIKQLLMQRYMNGGLPIIKLVEPNFRGKNILLLQHEWEGRTLKPNYTKSVLQSLHRLWRNPVALVTCNKNEEEILWYAVTEGSEQKVYELKGSEWEKI